MSDLYRSISFYGARHTSDEKLLRALLPDELAHTLLQRVGSLYQLAHLGLEELRNHGLSRTHALRVKAGLELGRRAAVDPAPGEPVHEPEDAYKCVAPSLAGEPRERFVVVVLDVKNRPRHVATVAEGSVELCPVDPREVFTTALRERGSAVLVAHNHPSGDPNPSAEDLELTDRLVRAGAMVGIPVLDHIIVGRADAFVSLAERGLLEAPDRQRAA